MYAGVAGVEFGGFGFFSLPTIGAAAEQDGYACGIVVGEELRVCGGLARGKDGELGAALGGLQLVGAEAGGVERGDLGGAGKLEGGVVERGGGDAGVAVVEGVLEGFGRGTDGGETAEAGDDDAVHGCPASGKSGVGGDAQRQRPLRRCFISLRTKGMGLPTV